MVYENKEIMEAFKLYLTLSSQGYAGKEELREYTTDDSVRAIVDQFAREADCTIFSAGDTLYMIPLAQNSVFHVSNETIKKDSKLSVNLDIYIMYLCIIVLFGEFYDSYQTTEPTRNFITIEEWLNSINERIESLSEHDEEKLKELDKEYDYNWTAIATKWTDMDEIKETSKKQRGNTISRVSFLDTVKNFLMKNELINYIGNNEIELTEKAMIIIQRYYMEYEFNRGILDFMYKLDNKKEDEK